MCGGEITCQQASHLEGQFVHSSVTVICVNNKWLSLLVSRIQNRVSVNSGYFAGSLLVPESVVLNCRVAFCSLSHPVVRFTMLFDEHLNILALFFQVTVAKCIQINLYIKCGCRSALYVCLSEGSPCPAGCTPAFALYFSVMLSGDDI